MISCGCVTLVPSHSTKANTASSPLCSIFRGLLGAGRQILPASATIMVIIFWNPQIRLPQGQWKCTVCCWGDHMLWVHSPSVLAGSAACGLHDTVRDKTLQEGNDLQLLSGISLKKKKKSAISLCPYFFFTLLVITYKREFLEAWITDQNPF